MLDGLTSPKGKPRPRFVAVLDKTLNEALAGPRFRNAWPSRRRGDAETPEQLSKLDVRRNREMGEGGEGRRSFNYSRTHPPIVMRCNPAGHAGGFEETGIFASPAHSRWGKNSAAPGFYSDRS